MFIVRVVLTLICGYYIMTEAFRVAREDVKWWQAISFVHLVVLLVAVILLWGSIPSD